MFCFRDKCFHLMHTITIWFFLSNNSFFHYPLSEKLEHNPYYLPTLFTSLRVSGENVVFFS